MCLEKLISIIVPVYNVAPYLKRCLDSIKDQSYKKFEVIIVNDGSTDCSREIAKKYTEIDSRFILIDRINGGLSAARNTGMTIAKGEYLVFIDSDDWAEPNFLESLLRNITVHKSDMACCRLRYMNLDKKKCYVYGKPFTREILVGKDIALDAFLVNSIHTAVWAKMYRTSFLKENNLKFYEGIVNEDTLFTTQVCLNAKKVSFVNQTLFNSLERSGSISRSSQEKLFRDMKIALDEIKSYIFKNNFNSKEILECYNTRYIKAMLYNLLQSAQRLPNDKFFEIHKLCMTETDYLKYNRAALRLPLAHKLFTKLSFNPYLFLIAFKLIHFLGFRMH